MLLVIDCPAERKANTVHDLEREHWLARRIAQIHSLLTRKLSPQIFYGPSGAWQTHCARRGPGWLGGWCVPYTQTRYFMLPAIEQWKKENTFLRW